MDDGRRLMYVKWCKIFRENFTNLQLATARALVNSSIRIDFLIWIMKTEVRSDVPLWNPTLWDGLGYGGIFCNGSDYKISDFRHNFLGEIVWWKRFFHYPQGRNSSPTLVTNLSELRICLGSLVIVTELNSPRRSKRCLLWWDPTELAFILWRFRLQ